MSGRIVIYNKDVCRLTGKSEKTSRELLKKIRQFKGKTKYQFICIADFSEYTGIPAELIMQHLID